MRIIDRLDEYINLKHINDNQIRVNCSLSVGLLGKARKTGNDLGKKAIDKILTFYHDLNRVWLLTGEGDMLKSDQATHLMKSEMVSVSAEAWDVIKKQANSLASKDRQVEELIILLKKDNVLKEGNVTCAAASGSDLEKHSDNQNILNIIF